MLRLLRTSGCSLAWGTAICWLLVGLAGIMQGQPHAGQVAGPLLTAERTGTPREPRSDASLARDLEHLRSSGKLEHFVQLATQSLGEPSTEPSLARWQCEALLATGQNRTAAERALQVAIGSPADRAAFLRLWATARLRMGEALEAPQLDGLLGASGNELVAAWRSLLKGAMPYEVARSGSAEIPLVRSTAWNGLSPCFGEGVPGEINGHPVEQMIFDTGGQTTIISTAAAQAAGVEMLRTPLDMIGFNGFEARPGVIRSLRLGSFELREVPVLVADPLGLTARRGDLAIGADLLHHLCLRLDYNARTATIAHKSSQLPSTVGAHEIRLFAFSQLAIAEFELASGDQGRVLLDTGNHLGTYASPQWLQSHPRGFSPLKTGQSYRGQLQPSRLGPLELPAWPVRGYLPQELVAQDVVDLMMGNDFFAGRCVTFELARQRLSVTDP